MVWPIDRQVAQQVWIDGMDGMATAGVRLLVQRLDAHLFHQRGHMLTAPCLNVHRHLCWTGDVGILVQVHSLKASTSVMPRFSLAQRVALFWGLIAPLCA